MGRPPNNGGPSFRFNPTEVAEMEAILQAHNTQVPSREVLVALSDKFSSSGDRAGKVTVHMKQVWNWFQNRRYALRAKAAKNPVKLSSSPAPPNNITAARNLPQALQHTSVTPCQAVPSAGQNTSDNLLMEYEARSTRDGAWYDVAAFISQRSVETTDPEVLVRFAGLGQEEDEWVNIRKHVRQRSLPCEASECVAVLPADLILCFQEGKDQALYYDAHVLDAQRRRHDVRGCRCRFLVRYDHDQSEEIVPLKKVCRRPETDYRMQQLAAAGNINRNKVNPEPHLGNTVIHPSSEAKEKLPKVESLAETKEQPKAAVQASTQPVQAPSTSATTAVVENSVIPAAVEAPATQPMAPVVTTTIPIALSTVSGATPPAVSTSNPSVNPSESRAAVTTTATATVSESITFGATLSSAGSTNPVAQAIASEANPFTESATCPAVHSIDSGVTLSPFSPTETISQATSGALPFATSATNEADPVCDSQATATSEAVQVSDSQASAIPVSDSQATASGNGAVPVSDSQATAPGNEAVPVSDSQATASTNEAVPVSNSQGIATNEAVPLSDSQATASMDEDVPVSDSQATASMDEDVPVSDSQATASMDEDVPVSDSQATASMGEDVPVSDSQATASMGEDVPVSDSQATASMGEDVPVSDSQATASMGEDVPVSDSQATASMDEDVPVSDSQAATSKNEAIPGSDSQATNDPITAGVTLSAATSTTPAGEFIDPGAIVTAAPVTPSMTSGASAWPTAHDADTAIQLSYSEVTVSLVPGTVVTDSITAEASLAASTTTPVVQPIDMVPTVTAPHVTHSTTSGGPASTATQDAICSLSGSATSAVTISSALVPNLSVAGATDSVGTDTIAAVSIPVNQAGASDSILPATTAPTANSDDLVVADTASIAGSCVSEAPEITDSVAVEED